MGFSRQEYWSGLPFPSPGNLPDPGIEPRSPALHADALTSEPPGKPLSCKTGILFCFIFFSSWPCLTACGILVPRTGVEPTPLAMKAWSPNYWTTGEFPYCFKNEHKWITQMKYTAGPHVTENITPHKNIVILCQICFVHNSPIIITLNISLWIFWLLLIGRIWVGEIWSH